MTAYAHSGIAVGELLSFYFMAEPLSDSSCVGDHRNQVPVGRQMKQCGMWFT